MKILLLQARNQNDPARLEERQSFAARLRLPTDQIALHDLLNGCPTLPQVKSYDALMMGGSGEYYVSKRNLPDFAQLLDLLRGVVELGHPMFASCFGFQCLVDALGGKVVHDPENTEVGTYELQLTREGQEDPLLGTLPSTFVAQLGRKDRAAQLPDKIPGLASSLRSPYQAFRVPGRPIWAFQFHPELNCEENRLRFFRYRDGYAAHMSPAEQEEAVERFRESPDTEQLLPRFLQLVFG